MRLWVVALTVMGLGLAACDQSSTSPEADAPSSQPPTGVAALNLQETQDFLESHAKEEGVVVTASGLHYKVLREGSGRTPDPTDQVKVHYAGRFLNGETFDSSYDRGAPAVFPANGLIKGWVEALTLMKEGAKWELAIHPDLAYGPGGRGPIPPNSTLLFDVELIEIVD